MFSGRGEGATQRAKLPGQPLMFIPYVQGLAATRTVQVRLEEFVPYVQGLVSGKFHPVTHTRLFPSHRG